MKFGMVVPYKTVISIYKFSINQFRGSRTLPERFHEFIFLLSVFLLIWLKFGKERDSCFEEFCAERPTLNCVDTRTSPRNFYIFILGGIKFSRINTHKISLSGCDFLVNRRRQTVIF